MVVAALLLLGVLLPTASSLAAPRRSRPRGGALRAEFAAADTAVLGDVSFVERLRAVAPSRMVPLSQPPLLLLQSSEPIVSAEGCDLLSRYFDQRATSDSCKLSDHEMCAAEELLRDVYDVIDEMTNCPRHEGEMQIPRYVRYGSKIIDDDELRLDAKKFGDALLPDGLHVDTNNGKLFRHITAILYLTDNEERVTTDGGCFCAGGGTAFPLAVPRDPEDRIECNEMLQSAARSLLERGIHHTKGDAGEDDMADGRVLENAALDAFHVTNVNLLKPNEPQFLNTQPKGLRVMPEAGKLIYFHNVDDDGLPDELSFHGGEELIDIMLNDGRRDVSRIDSRTKSILVCFKEVPIESFRDSGREGFAERAKKARSWTKESYF